MWWGTILFVGMVIFVLLIFPKRRKSIKNSIEELLYDNDRFAELIANAKLSTLPIELYKYRESVVESWLIILEKKQFKTIEEAFSALFKKLLFEAEGWDVAKEPLPSDKQWKENLRKHFIHEYFFKWDEISFESVDINLIFGSMEGDFREFNTIGSNLNRFLTKVNKVEAIQVKKGHADELIFGQNNNYYFIYEWGIYD